MGKCNDFHVKISRNKLFMLDVEFVERSFSGRIFYFNTIL